MRPSLCLLPKPFPPNRRRCASFGASPERLECLPKNTHGHTPRRADAGASVTHEVVYLHGRGSSEREAGRLLPLLGDAHVRSYLGPLPEGRGFAWFLKTAIAVAEPESLAQELSKVQDWIRADSGYRKPIFLCGFSNGAAMAGSLMLRDPQR